MQKDGQWFVAQLVERSLPTPEVRSSNPVIGEIFLQHCLLSTALKRQNKEKEAGNGPIKKMQKDKNKEK